MLNALGSPPGSLGQQPLRLLAQTQTGAATGPGSSTMILGALDVTVVGLSSYPRIPPRSRAAARAKNRATSISGYLVYVKTACISVTSMWVDSTPPSSRAAERATS